MMFGLVCDKDMSIEIFQAGRQEKIHITTFNLLINDWFESN